MNMRIVLDKKTQKFIAERVSAGEYSDPSEVVRDALHLLRDKHAKKRQRLHKAVQAGLDDIAKGRFETVEPTGIGAFVRSLRPKPGTAKALTGGASARRK